MLKHKFNKPHLNLHHQFPKIQNKPQNQLAFPKKKKKGFCLHKAQNKRPLDLRRKEQWQ